MYACLSLQSNDTVTPISHLTQTHSVAMQSSQTEHLALYHERQQELRCGRHALNALFQAPVFDNARLAEIGRQPIDGNIRVEDVAHLHGNYDFMHLLAALARECPDLDAIYWDRIGNAAEYDAFLLWANYHYTSIRCVQGYYIHFDALLASPTLIQEDIHTYIRSYKVGQRRTIFALTGLPNVDVRPYANAVVALPSNHNTQIPPRIPFKTNPGVPTAVTKTDTSDTDISMRLSQSESLEDSPILFRDSYGQPIKESDMIFLSPKCCSTSTDSVFRSTGGNKNPIQDVFSSGDNPIGVVPSQGDEQQDTQTSPAAEKTQEQNTESNGAGEQTDSNGGVSLQGTVESSEVSKRTEPPQEQGSSLPAAKRQREEGFSLSETHSALLKLFFIGPPPYEKSVRWVPKKFVLKDLENIARGVFLMLPGRAVRLTYTATEVHEGQASPAQEIHPSQPIGRFLSNGYCIHVNLR